MVCANNQKCVAEPSGSPPGFANRNHKQSLTVTLTLSLTPILAVILTLRPKLLNLLLKSSLLNV